MEIRPTCCPLGNLFLSYFTAEEVSCQRLITTCVASYPCSIYLSTVFWMTGLLATRPVEFVISSLGNTATTWYYCIYSMHVRGLSWDERGAQCRRCEPIYQLHHKQSRSLSHSSISCMALRGPCPQVQPFTHSQFTSLGVKPIRTGQNRALCMVNASTSLA